MPAPKRLSVHHILDLFRHPPADTVLVSAHRGLRWDGVPENSKEAVLAAATAGLICVEVDISLSSDGEPILFHDDYLGRATNIAEVDGVQDIYSPFTGNGYSPRYDSIPWAGGLAQLKLKNETGHVCEEGILHLDELLSFIREQRLDIVVFLDIKEKAAVARAYSVLKRHTNARGVSAIEWCVWKMDALFYTSPSELEAAPWFQDAQRTSKPAYIPVFRPNAPAALDVIAAAKAWATRPYVLAFEVGLRGPGGNLQALLNWLVSAGLSVGYFGTYGDIHPASCAAELFDPGALDFTAARDPDAPTLCFQERKPPATYHSIVAPGEALDGRDSRAELELYKGMGYSWTIGDLTRRTAKLFRNQGRVQPPLNTAWWERRLATVE